MRFLNDLEVSFDLQHCCGVKHTAVTDMHGGKTTSEFYVDGSQVTETTSRKV